MLDKSSQCFAKGNKQEWSLSCNVRNSALWEYSIISLMAEVWIMWHSLLLLHNKSMTLVIILNFRNTDN